MKKVVFAQGFGDYSDNVWPGWLESEIKKNGFDFVWVKIPAPMYPEVHDWIKDIQDMNLKIDNQTYFVGHSLGCITIARYLETLPADIKAGGCVFVAPFCSFPEFPLISGFCTLPLDWQKVRSKAGDVFVILSDDDKMVPVPLGKEFAENIGADIVMEEGRGHFKEDVKTIPSLLNAILEIDIEREKREQML